MYNPEDLLAAEREMAFGGGWYLHPIYKNGDYPEIMKQQIAKKSSQQGYEQSRLPEFTEEEKHKINGKISIQNKCTRAQGIDSLLQWLERLT